MHSVYQEFDLNATKIRLVGSKKTSPGKISPAGFPAAQIYRLPSLPEMRGGGHADVHVYFKCPPTKQIR